MGVPPAVTGDLPWIRSHLGRGKKQKLLLRAVSLLRLNTWRESIAAEGCLLLSQGPSAPPHPIAVFPPPCVNMQHTLIQKYTHTLSYRRDALMHTDTAEAWF